MLKNDFYEIINTFTNENSADFVILLHSNHTIFNAHFPNNPIVPGACIVQILKELFETLKETSCVIQKIKNIKFTAPIIPTIHQQINFKLEWENEDEAGLTRVKTTVYSNEVIFSKINLQLKQKLT